MPATAIAPIVAVIILILSAFGINIDESALTEAINNLLIGVSAIIAIYGIFKNHKKKDKGAN